MCHENMLQWCAGSYETVIRGQTALLPARVDMSRTNTIEILELFCTGESHFKADSGLGDKKIPFHGSEHI